MYFFLIPLLLGFTANILSAFTTIYSRRLGPRRGSLVTALLRNVFGIPVWALGFALAVRATHPSLSLFPTNPVIQTFAILLLIVGGVIILLALRQIRLRAAVPSTADALVESGLYACVRHPIHSGTLLEFAGLFLFIPTVPVALACGLGALWVLAQTRAEEYDLMQRIPSYREYMRRVPGFLPRIRKSTGNK